MGVRIGYLYVFMAVLVVLSASGCTGSSPEEKTVTVFAAASLTEAFTELKEVYEAEHPDERVELNFAGSNTLKIQIEQGAKADLYVSANMKYMDELIEKGYISESREFARNRLVIIIPRDNPGEIKSPEDLAKDIRLVIAQEAVPVGRYALESLDKMEKEFGSGFKKEVLSRVVSDEDAVKGVVSKVVLGEVDAGIVYFTDAVAERETVAVIEIPDRFNVVARYPIGLLREASNPEGGRSFMNFVLSPKGKEILKAHGFIVEGL